VNFDDFLVGLRSRHPDWFAANAQNRPQEPVAVKKAPEVVKLENVPQTPPKPPAADAVDEGWDAAELVESEETEWWNL